MRKPLCISSGFAVMIFLSGIWRMQPLVMHILHLITRQRQQTMYLKAAKRNVNDFSTPVYLMKAAQTYEHLGNWKKAIDIYERIKTEHFQTQEGREAEKFIARAEAMMK
jgi:hypothetical protein